MARSPVLPPSRADPPPLPSPSYNTSLANITTYIDAISKQTQFLATINTPQVGGGRPSVAGQRRFRRRAHLPYRSPSSRPAVLLRHHQLGERHVPEDGQRGLPVRHLRHRAGRVRLAVFRAAVQSGRHRRVGVGAGASVGVRVCGRRAPTARPLTLKRRRFGRRLYPDLDRHHPRRLNDPYRRAVDEYSSANGREQNQKGEDAVAVRGVARASRPRRPP